MAANVTCYFTGRIYRDGEWFVSKCDSLPVTTQGATEAEAVANLVEATQLFIESCLSRGTLEAVLRKYGWHPVHEVSPHSLPPDSFAAPLRVAPNVANALECFA
jgi:predicted RNase H-like HicB family nuclease